MDALSCLCVCVGEEFVYSNVCFSSISIIVDKFHGFSMLVSVYVGLDKVICVGSGSYSLCF